MFIWKTASNPIIIIYSGVREQSHYEENENISESYELRSNRAWAICSATTKIGIIVTSVCVSKIFVTKLSQNVRK